MRRFYGAAITLLLLGSLTVLAQTQSPEKQTAQNETKQSKKSLVPSKEERLKYAESLKSPGTRLIRLLPREKYDVQASRQSPDVGSGSFTRKTFGDNTNLDDVPHYDSYPQAIKTNSPVRGGGAYYSFTYRTHQYGDASHLSLSKGQFEVGFSGANYGFLTNLGDVPLESVSLNTPAANLPATYKRATLDRDARREHRRFGEGVVVDGITFNRSLPMAPHSTYLLRAVNYGNSDVLVAFRVVEVESDGTALILWKLLKRSSTPRLDR
jgi:hypothetical protein